MIKQVSYIYKKIDPHAELSGGQTEVTVEYRLWADVPPKERERVNSRIRGKSSKDSIGLKLDSIGNYFSMRYELEYNKNTKVFESVPCRSYKQIKVKPRPFLGVDIIATKEGQVPLEEMLDVRELERFLITGEYSQPEKE